MATSTRHPSPVARLCTSAALMAANTLMPER